MVRERRGRREREREMGKAVRRLQLAAGAAVGGAAAHPFSVVSASVIDGAARGVPCIQCAGQLEPRADRAIATPRGVLRQLEMICRRCHAPRTLWFLIAPAGAN